MLMFLLSYILGVVNGFNTDMKNRFYLFNCACIFDQSKLLIAHTVSHNSKKSGF